MIPSGECQERLEHCIERATAPLMNLLTSFPSSALCAAAVDEINRLMQDNFDFWVEHWCDAGESSEHYDPEEIARILRRYETAAEALSPEVRERAREGAAEAWVRLETLPQ